MMELSQESLAGRVALLHMSSLSQHKIYGTGQLLPFTIKPDALRMRRIWTGSMPELLSRRFRDRDVFYSSYLQTYIECDVSDVIALTDKLLFQDFVRAAACRVGQMLNIHDIALDIDVSDDTAKRWLQVLENSDIIFYLRPHSNNLLKRTVKTPKFYFFIPVWSHI